MMIHASGPSATNHTRDGIVVAAVSEPAQLTKRARLRDHAAMGRDGPLFPARHGEQLAPSTLYKVYYPVRGKAARQDLRFHDLRHARAVLAAATGATLAELMSRLGHSAPGAALRYQHAPKNAPASSLPSSRNSTSLMA